MACNVNKQEDNDTISPGLRSDFFNPPQEYRPETWFHINGNNISKIGLTKDLEAIKYAGLQGIQLFNKSGGPYPGVEQIKILSPEWEEMIRHAADECKRLGLKFTMQNCPGWSMTGGPWVPAEEAQRELVHTLFRVEGGKRIEKVLNIEKKYLGEELDYKDVCVVAFPTPRDDTLQPHIPTTIETNNPVVPWENIFNPEKFIDFGGSDVPDKFKEYSEHALSKVNGENTWVLVEFEKPVTLRSLQLPPIRSAITDRQYPQVDVGLTLYYANGVDWVKVAEFEIPNSNWTDQQYDLTLALNEFTAKKLKLTFSGDHSFLLTRLHFSSQPRVHNYEAKAAKAVRNFQHEVKYDYPEEYRLKKSAILDLTGKMNKLGQLNWNAPDGKWTVLRFGHVNMRRTNKPAVPEATGWECSKLDKEAIENHLRQGMIGNLIKEGGPIGDGKLQGLLIDSWESMVPNWTMKSERLFQEFRERRGYDMKLYLPAILGYIVDDSETTERFLRDLRATLDDLFVENFFSHFVTVAHDLGTKVYTEGATGEVLPGDPMRYYGTSDFPMTEFWYPKPPSNQNENAKPVTVAASAAHLYNKPLLAAEACTQLNVQWNEHPFVVKYLTDYNFTKGINHLVFHTFSHTPQVEVYPGSSFGGSIGFPLVRNQTWWHHTPSWIDYLSRCQVMLRQGEFVADVLWYLGDDLERPPFETTDFPRGYRYDYLNAEILHSRLSVEDGKIQVEGAGEYQIIVLRNSKRMLLSTAQKLKELVLAGAVVLGEKPLTSPSLMDDENDLEILRKIAEELWGDEETGMKKVGKGKVYWGKGIEEVLEAEIIQKDVEVAQELKINWIHQKTENAEIYFVSSMHDIPVDVSLSFRENNKYPEIWDPLTGESKPAPVWERKDGRTNLALNFASSGSQIIVFQNEEKMPVCREVTYKEKTILSSDKDWFRVHESKTHPTIEFDKNEVIVSHPGIYSLDTEKKKKELKLSVVIIEINDAWTLTFEEGWDAPSTLKTGSLISLADHENEAVSHYSGTVTYERDVEYQESGDKVLLDLGEVANIAEVWINNEKLGTRWAPPFKFDLTGKLKEGKNRLKVLVTNTWRNQLIYDWERPLNQKKTWTTNPPTNQHDLEMSGLIGPVILRTISKGQEL